MIGLNSSFTQARVKAPATDAYVVFSSINKIQRRKSFTSAGTYKPPSSGIQSHIAFSKPMLIFLFLVLVKRISTV